MPWTPQQGDFIVINFDPQSGHEQKGRRPALVVSNSKFNQRTGLLICCAITNTARGIPFHVPVPAASGLTGFIMAEQVKSVDFRSRKAVRIGKADAATLEQVQSILEACLS